MRKVYREFEQQTKSLNDRERTRLSRQVRQYGLKDASEETLAMKIPLM